MDQSIREFISSAITERGTKNDLGGNFTSAAIGLTINYDALPIQAKDPAGYTTITIVVAEHGLYLLSGYMLPRSFLSNLLKFFVASPEARFVKPWVHYIPRERLRSAIEGAALPMGGKTFSFEYERGEGEVQHLDFNLQKGEVAAVINELSQMAS